MLLTVGLCLLAAAILVAAVVVFLLRNRHIARLKLKDLTQSVDTEATRDYQVGIQDFILDLLTMQMEPRLYGYWLLCG